MTRRRKEPGALELIRFIADNESLHLTCDEYPELGEERLRQLLREHADALGAPPRERAPMAEAEPARGKQLQVEVFTDGAARGNPGPAGAGWVIRGLNGSTLAQAGKLFLGRRTNNEAEYEAVIHSLKAAHALGAVDVALRSDSELLVRQLNGQYRVMEERLGRLHAAARALIQQFRRVDVRHVPRARNSEADEQANLAIDEAIAHDQTAELDS